MLLQMAKDALFTKEPTITVHNAEGAILLQLLFQIFAGTQCLNEYFEEIMNLVKGRLSSQPMQTHLKRHLLGVFLTALAYNPSLTLAYFEHVGITADFFK